MTDLRSRAAFDSGYSSVIDCHSTGYHALGSQGWLPTLELLHSSAHTAPTSIIDRTAVTTSRGANFNAHAKMPPSEGRKLIRVFTEYRYLLGAWCGIAVHTEARNMFLAIFPTMHFLGFQLSNSSPPLKA
jgi:hypothetical protein